jgi:hypothetical protein
VVAGAEQRREIAERPEVSVGHLPVAVDLGLLDLQFGKGLVCLLPLAGELGPIVCGVLKAAPRRYGRVGCRRLVG